MDNDTQLVGVRRTDKQLLTDIFWRMQYRIRQRVICRISLWNYVSYNRMRGRNVI